MTIKWTIIFTEHAEKAFSKLDRPTQKEIKKYLSQRVLAADTPRTLGKALKRNLSGY